MKKIIKKIEIKPLLFSIGLMIFQSLTYLLVKIFQGPTHLLNSPLDDKIPFISLFILIYVFWYFLLFFVPYNFYIKDKESFYKYVVSILIAILFSDIIFIIYPTEVIRPTIENTNVLNIITNLIYLVDTPAINCLPSMHCSISMLFILSTLFSKKTTKKYKTFIIISSILIMLSTLFVKQHVIIDLITGDLLMIIIFMYVNKSKKIVNYAKKILKI